MSAAGLKIDPSHRVVMLGTSPVPPAQRRLLAEWFCEALLNLTASRASSACTHPKALSSMPTSPEGIPKSGSWTISQLSLDESLAATDVVVVQSSGLGSDALVKRRLTVVVEIPDAPLHHGKDLIEQAGCPRASSAEQLAAALCCLLFDDEARRRHTAAAEQFVADFWRTSIRTQHAKSQKQFYRRSKPGRKAGDEAQ